MNIFEKRISKVSSFHRFRFKNNVEMIIMSIENAFEEGAVTSNAKLKDTFVKVEIQSEPDNPIELDSQGKTSDQQASYESIEASIESLLEAPVENILSR